METPVLLIVFNRIDTVKDVFESIRKLKPRRLYVSADGPRLNIQGDYIKCNEVRNWIVSNVDWNCDLKTRFLEKNLGCGIGPSSAISWFFEHEEQGIILEDDCVPHPDFFTFAQIMLDKYKENHDVMAINSSNFQTAPIGDGSYYFSMQNGPFCAWATWKRAWESFDYAMLRYPRSIISNALIHFYKVTKKERLWWLNIYDDLQNGVYNNSSWDYQYIFAIWANRGKSIVPNSNLSTNIGFGSDATHTTNTDDVTANRISYPLLPIVYPTSEQINRQADLNYHLFYYDKFVDYTPLWKKIKRLIKRLVKSK